RERREAVDDPSIVVTGMGVASALGTGRDALWEGVEQGRGGLRPITRFSTEGFTATMAGLWPAWDGRPCPAPGIALPPVRTLPTEGIPIVPAREARAQARLPEARVPAGRI